MTAHLLTAPACSPDPAAADEAGLYDEMFETGGEGVDWNDSRRKILDAVEQLEREP